MLLTNGLTACGLLCFQCTSNSTINCGDGMIHMGGIEPKNCDHVFEAQYCIKMTGIWKMTAVKFDR